jgi:hypothetical protein
MTATPIEGLAPVVWFLTARDGGSSVRITPGLTLREDGTGRLLLGTRADAHGWIRFDIENEAPWVTVTSPQFTLASGTRVLGARLRLDETLELALPSTVFQISRSFADRGRARRTQVRLVRVDSNRGEPESPPIRLLPSVAEREHAIEEEAFEEVMLDIAAPLPAYAAPSSAPPKRTTAPAAVVARRARIPQPPPRRWRMTAILVGVAALLLALEVATPVRSPLAQHDDVLAAATESPSEAGAVAATSTEVSPLIASVEALLAASEGLAEGPDDATLRFAVEAYQLAAHEQPENRALQSRLAELRGRLMTRR